MRFVAVSFMLSFLVLLSSCSQILENMDWGVIQYNDSIVEVYNAGLHDYMAYDTYYIETSWDFFDNIEKRRVDTIANLEQYKFQLEQIWDYRWDSLLVDATIQNLQDIIDVLSNQYKELLDIYVQVSAEELDEDGYNERMQELSDEITVIDNIIVERIQIAQSTFAETHNYEILTWE